MGIKIYNGYKLPMMSLKELTVFTQKFRKMAEEKSADIIMKFLAQEISYMLDNLRTLDEEQFVREHVIFDKEREKLSEQQKLEARGFVFEEKEKISLKLDDYKYRTAYAVAYRKSEQRYSDIQRTQYRDPDVDFDCDACFIPLEDKILVTFHTEKKELRELWESCAEVSYYGYWGGDPQEGVSEEEWEKRREEWSIALPGAGVPMQNGLSADFIKGFPSMHFLHPMKVLTYMPTLEERVSRIAYRIVIDRKFNEIRATLSDEEKEDGIEVYHQARRWMRTDEGKQALVSEEELILPKLEPFFTKGHLLTHICKLAKGEIDPFYEKDEKEDEEGGA